MKTTDQVQFPSPTSQHLRCATICLLIATISSTAPFCPANVAVAQPQNQTQSVLESNRSKRKTAPNNASAFPKSRIEKFRAPSIFVRPGPLVPTESMAAPHGVPAIQFKRTKLNALSITSLPPTPEVAFKPLPSVSLSVTKEPPHQNAPANLMDSVRNQSGSKNISYKRESNPRPPKIIELTDLPTIEPSLTDSKPSLQMPPDFENVAPANDPAIVTDPSVAATYDPNSGEQDFPERPESGELTLVQLENAVRNSLFAAAGSESFDMARVIDTLLRNSPLIRVAELEVGIRSGDVRREDANFDWVTFIETTWAESNQPVASSLDGAASRVESHNLDLSAGLRKQNRFGGNFSLQQDAGLSDSNSSFFDPQNQADANIGIEFQQPLFRGGGRKFATSRYKIAAVDKRTSEADLTAQLQTQIEAAASAYWSLVAARGEYYIQQRTLELGQEIIQVIENRVGVDTGPEQLIRAKSNLATRQRDFLRAKYGLLSAQERLAQLIFGANYKLGTEFEIVTTAQNLEPNFLTNLDSELEIALQNRPEIKRVLTTIEKASIEKGVSKNQLLPQLDLAFAISNRGLRGNRALGSAYDDQFSLGDPTYSFGLSYQLPYRNRAAKAGMKQAELRIQQFQQQLQQQISEISLEMQLLQFDLARADESLKIARTLFETASQEYDVRINRYLLMIDESTGIANYLDSLFSAQDRLASAQRDYIQALTDFNLIDIRLQRARGTLLIGPPVSTSNEK